MLIIYFRINLIMYLKYFSLEELNVAWAHMEDDDLHYLLAKMVPSMKRLNISGFLKQLADYGKFFDYIF